MKFTAIPLAGLALASSLHAQGVKTSEQPYLLAAPSADFTFEPIITVGDRVQLTGGAAAGYAFAGIPDAMGIYKDAVSGENILFVAHETGSTVNTTPVPGQTAYRGAFVSRFVMAADGGVISGAPAHKNLFLENTLQANRPPQAGDTNAFTRFCSGSFAGTAHGLDRPMFFTNEESATGNYDAAGSQSVVIVDGNMHTLPDLGRVARESTVVQPRRDSITAILSTEDNGSPSYVYMYVGQKQRRSSSVLDKNGLTNGKTYVLAGRDLQHNEGTFTTGSLPMKWVEVPNAASLSASDLINAADAVGAFGFVRVEDTEFDPAQPTRSLFLATTGGSGPNRLGRLYEVTLTPTNPVGPATMTVVYNADLIATPGGTFNGSVGKLQTANGVTGSLGTYSGFDINAGVNFPVSIDNIAVSQNFIVVCEDTNGPANDIYTKYNRNSGLWTLDRTNNYAAKLQSTFNYSTIEARDGLTSPFFSPGQWESSGVIASDAIFGPGTFVVNVQGHNQTRSTVTSGRTTAPNGLGGNLTSAQFRAAYAEDGQVLIMRPQP